VSAHAGQTVLHANPVTRPLLVARRLLLLPCLSACETVVVCEFKVVNNSSQPIHVAVKTPHAETRMAIVPGDSKVLLERQQLNSRVQSYFQPADTIWWFSRLEITAANQRAVNKDLRRAAYWVFRKRRAMTER
jgi:hypothetical protein